LAEVVKKIRGVIEGLIVTVIGLYMGLLVLFGDYWRFLNPKFKWLTGAAAVILIVFLFFIQSWFAPPPLVMQTQ
jgi:hypothetical protein